MTRRMGVSSSQRYKKWTNKGKWIWVISDFFSSNMYVVVFVDQVFKGEGRMSGRFWKRFEETICDRFDDEEWPGASYGADLKRLSATYMMMKNDLELSLHTVKLEILLVWNRKVIAIARRDVGMMELERFITAAGEDYIYVSGPLVYP